MRFGDDSAAVYEYVSECGSLGCRAQVKLTLAEYEASEPGSVRAH
jgi:hypothetical protein